MFRKENCITLVLGVAVMGSCLMAGCGKDTPPVPPPAPPTVSTKPAENKPVEEPTAEETPIPESTQIPTVVEPLEHTPTYMDGAGETHTGIFTVVLPETWREKYVCLNEETDMTYGLAFYEKSDYEAGLGGCLLTLTVIDAGDYFVGKRLGTILTPEGYAKDLIAEYPMDFAGSSTTAQELGRDIPDILESIALAEGCTFMNPSEIQSTYSSRANGHWMCNATTLDTLYLDIFGDGVFVYASANTGKIIDVFGGEYEILFDDGMYQRFRFTSDEDTPFSWEASLYQTELKDNSGIKYTGLVYQKDNGETMYFTGTKRPDDDMGKDRLPLIISGYKIG